jgi:hypothetical protein
MVQGERSSSPGSGGDRRGLQRQIRPSLAQGSQTTRTSETGTGPLSRQPRPARISFEDPKAESLLGFKTSTISWAVLFGGMLLAVAGVVQASWLSNEQDKTSPSIAEEVLNKQIAQLKAELDEERAEKTELTERIAAVKELSPEPTPAAEQIVTQTASVPGSATNSEEPSLPEPMAPSVELLLSDLPLNSVPVNSGATGSKTSAYAIHLASFADRTMAERGWQLLQRNHSNALGELKPRIEEAKDDKGNPMFLLLAGPFDTQELAAAHCKKITTQVVFCKPRLFIGSEFAASVAQ